MNTDDARQYMDRPWRSPKTRQVISDLLDEIYRLRAANQSFANEPGHSFLEVLDNAINRSDSQ